MNNKARLDKQRRGDRALARIAKEHREREFAELSATQAGQSLLSLLNEMRTASFASWPALVARQPWLFAQTSDFRTTAVRLLDDLWCDRVAATGGDPMDEPLPWAEPSAFQRVRWALTTPQAARPASLPKKASTKPMLNMTLNGPDDVPVLKATIAALHGALCGTTALTPAATAEGEESAETSRRKRRTKAEIEADNAAAAAAQATPVTPATPATPAPAEEDDVLAMLGDTPAEPAAPANPWDACYTKTYTRDEVNAALRTWATKAGGAATRALLNHLGAQNSSSIAPEKFSECMAVLQGKPI